MHKRTIVAFVGFQGSGKTTLSKKLARHLKCSYYETSEIVKELTKVLSRQSLPETGERTKEDPEWLGRGIKDRIESSFEYKPVVVVSGIREYEVIKYLQKDHNVVIFEVVALPETRLKRVLEQDKVKDAREFLEHELKEKELGVEQVMLVAPHRIVTRDDTDPDELMKEVVKKLLEKGYRLR